MDPLEGDGMALRMPGRADVEGMARVLQAEGLDGADALARAGDLVDRSPTLEDGGFLALVVEAAGAVVGSMQARAPSHAFPPGVCEIGITLLPQARGHGLGRQAVRLLTEFLHKQAWHRVQAATAHDNQAMRRVLESCSYAFEGILRDFAPGADGLWVDYAMYAAIRPR